MRSRRTLLKILAATFIVVLLSAAVIVNVHAEPYADYTIVNDNKTIIKATDFDSGVYGKAAAEGNKDIRPDETVNTEVGSSEYGGNIGWIAAGDWVQYTVNVAADGNYRISVWMASDSETPGGVKVYYNDVEAGTSENARKEGWQVYSLYFVADVELKAGTAVLKTEYTNGLNICAIEIHPLGENGFPIWIPTEYKIKTYGTTTINAVDFDPGVYGKTAAEGNKDIRPDEEVNTEIGESVYGGNIGYITAGDWVQYTVNFQRDGNYTFDAWIASGSETPGGVKVYCDDVELGTSPNALNVGWQAYDRYTAATADILAGEHVIKVEFTGGVNFAALDVVRNGNIEVVEEETEPEEETMPPTGDLSPETESAPTTNDTSGGGNTTMIIIIAAVVVVIVVVVIIVVVSKNKKKQ